MGGAVSPDGGMAEVGMLLSGASWLRIYLEHRINPGPLNRLSKIAHIRTISQRRSMNMGLGKMGAVNRSRVILALLLSPIVCVAADLEPAKAKQIDALFGPFTGNVPGASVMVIHNGATFYKKAYGMANMNVRLPETTETNYRLASVT